MAALGAVTHEPVCACAHAHCTAAASTWAPLSCLQVGQTAFVLSERQGCGTEAVTGTLLLGLLLMLPHVLAVLWVVDSLQLFPDEGV